MDGVNPWSDAVVDETAPSVTYEEIVATMRRFEQWEPVIVARPEASSVMRRLFDDRLRVVESTHVERGEAYIFYPAALSFEGGQFVMEEDTLGHHAKIVNITDI